MFLRSKSLEAHSYLKNNIDDFEESGNILAIQTFVFQYFLSPNKKRYLRVCIQGIPNLNVESLETGDE